MFLFVLFNSISKTYAVDCLPPSINASCDLNTTASKLIISSNPESLELNINANVNGGSYESVLIDITSILGTNAINVGSGVTISTTGYRNPGEFKLFNFRQQAAYSLTNRGTLYASFYTSSYSNGTAAAILVGTNSPVTLIDNYGSISHEIDWGIRNFGTIGTISNQSTGTLNGIANINGGAEITKIHNIGTIGTNSSTNVGAIYNKNGSTIGTIRNEGSIIGYSSGSTYKDAILNEGGEIDVIENLGTIQIGNPFQPIFDIHNKGVGARINELINAQGKATNDALSYKGALPTYYKILINSASDYGQFRGSSVSGKMTFSIAEDSDISFGASNSYTSYDSTDTLNPTPSTAYKINSDKDITIVVNDDVTVTGPEHNLFIEDAANFNLTVNSGKTYKNEAGSYGDQTYEDVFAGLSSSSFNATSGTTTLDGTPISWSLSEDTNDLTIASSETAQSGEVVHIDDESLVDVNITNNGTIWSTENNAIAFDGTTITGTATITNTSSGTIQSDSTAIDEAAIAIKDTTGTINISNAGTITSKAQGILNKGSTIKSLTNTGTLETTGTGTDSISKAGIYNASRSTVTTLNNNFGATLKGTGSYTSGIYNLDTITSLSNAGTLQGTGSIESSGIYNLGTISTITNSGDLASTGTGTGSINKAGIYNAASATVTTITNSGNIDGTGSYTSGIHNLGTISTIISSGNLRGEGSANSSGIYNSGNIGTITNSGYIASINNYGIYNSGNIGTITHRNSMNGTISSTNSHAILNTGTITNLENSIFISSGAGFFNIDNILGSITNLYNSQGLAGASSDPLTLTGNLPTNYFVTIDSTVNYGQLSVTSGLGNMKFGITEGSVIGVPTTNYHAYDSAATLNPAASTPYKIEAIGTDITVIADNDWTVTGPLHNILVEDAENFNLTINAGITAKNEKGSIAGATYESVLSGVSASQIASETTQTVELDGVDVTFTLAETSTSGTWDLSTNAVSDQSGQVVHIDNTSINDVTITNNGTIWSTENNAIEIESTEITGTATITNTSTGTIQSDSTELDEAAIVIKDTTGTINISNAGTITSKAQGILNKGSTIKSLTNSGTLETTGTWSTSLDIGSLYNDEASTITSLTNSGTMKGTKPNRSGIVNKGTIRTLTNSGTIQGTGVTLSYGLFNTGTITSLTNDSVGIISSANSKGLNNTGIITRLKNEGTIQGTGNSNSEGLYNSGTINFLSNDSTATITSTFNVGLRNDDTINHLYNGGTISSTNNYGLYNTLSNTIADFKNTGTISSTKSFAIVNVGAMTDFENSGTISSRTMINNAGTITNLYNSQGLAGASSDPLTLTGNLPTNYFVTIDSTVNYGQLSVTSGLGNMKFGITEGSVIGVPTTNYHAYDSAATLNPAASTPYKIEAIGTDITVIADNDWTVTGPLHNILVEDAENFNLTINAGITAKNEKGSIAGATYESVLSGVSASQIASETTQTVELDGVDVTFTLAETSTSGTWDLSTNAVSDQSGQVVHIDNTSINDVTITNNGTIWSTENNAIEMDGTDIRGAATITNNTDATIRSDSTATDEAAIAIKDTTGTLVISNIGTITGPNGLLVDNSIITFTNRGTVTATVGEALLLKNNAFVNLTNTGTMSGPNGINIIGTAPTISNTGTVTSSGNNNAALYNTGTLTSLNNTGTLEGTGSSNSYGLYSSGSIARNENSGSITSTNSSGLYNLGTVNELINNSGSGISSTNSHGLQNDGTITWLINSGTISTESASSYGVYNTSPNTIVNFVNEGSITSNNDGVNNNPGAITNFENAGIISSGVGFFDIDNTSGSITNLYNNQGAATSDPLTLTGNLPTNYFVTIDSITDFGQLDVTSGSGNINFGITEGSVIGVPTATKITYSSAAILNPNDGVAYQIDGNGTDITVIVESDYTVTGPSHNIAVDEAESFSLTIDRNVIAKNEKGSIAGATYESVLSGVSASQIASETTQTVELDGVDVTFNLTETSTSGTWDLSTNAVSDQSGQVVHIDNTSINDVTITNNGTIWSTENNAIEMDGTTISNTATITNNTDATIRSDSTAIDEAAVVIKDTIGSLNINNTGTMTGPHGLLVDNATVTFTNRGTVTGSLYDVNNAGTLTINNNQGALTSDPLTLTGKLPTYNMLIVNTEDYGQLAVTNGTGTLDFDVADTSKLESDDTYANVLSGVSDEQIKDLAKTFTRSGVTYEWQLEQTSTNVWQLDVASLDEIMEDNVISFPNYINKVNATLNHGVAIANFAQQNYQCNVFGQNNGCFAAGGRYTDLTDPSGDSQAAVFMAGYQLPEQKVRFSVFVDQSIDNNSVSGVKLENHGPMMGFKGVWQQNYDGTGMIFSIANTYQNQDAKITRNTVYQDSEKGQGSTDIETQTYRAELMYGYLYNQDTFMNPYVALQYDIAEQDGYTESASRQTSFPLTFSGVKDETTSIRAGLQLRHRLANQKTFLFGSAGLEHDLSSSSDDQVTASYQGYSFSADLNNDTNETRANALFGVDHFVSPTQKMSISVNYQELAWGGSSSDAITGFASYTIGF